MAPTAVSSSKPSHTSARAPAAQQRAGGQASAAGYATAGQSIARTMRTLPGAEEEMSPRLMPIDASTALGSPLLVEPENHEPEERFCMDGPVIAPPGMPSRRPVVHSDEALPFTTLVARMDSAVGQASLLLTDRCRTLRLRVQKTVLSESQVGELCEIADAVAAAAYHLRKWVALLGPEVGAVHKPPKPTMCEDKDEAFAALSFAMPHIVVSAAEAYKSFKRIMEERGDEAEPTVNILGVPTDDVRALAPHLEAVLFRMGRLSARLRTPEKQHDFAPHPRDDVANLVAEFAQEARLEA